MTDRPFAITLDVGSSHANHTGAWRVERPLYVDLVPPCSDACPAGEDVRGWLYDAEAGDYEAAWRRLVERNPFPAVMGRICYHPCETACNRAELDEAVGINAVERALGDMAIEHGWALPSPGRDTGRRVLVVGAGPAGLSATYHLRRLGHAVTLVDSATGLGGMMRYGIPAYRLPRSIIDAEIARILALGVDVQLDHPVTDVEKERADAGADAVLLAVGAQLAKRVDIPAPDSARVLDALSLLKGVAEGDVPLLGRRVAVYGGGNTALDAARTARRLGAIDTVVVYRRNRERMPAQEEELAQALGEGVEMRWLSTIGGFDGRRLVVEKMRLGDDGFPVPTGETEELDADALVLALGQDTDLSCLGSADGVAVEDGVVSIDASMMTGHAGLFAGGDDVPSQRTATLAIGHGRKAALGIDAWLSGPRPARTPAADEPAEQVAAFERLNTWYYSEAPRSHRPQLEMIRRQSTFDEVVLGLTEENALFEARRCLSCGSCFQCDNCYGVCPDNAVVKLGMPGGESVADDGRRYRIDYDFCKGCGICAAECPCGAIEMVPERI